jgi:ribosomal protein S18 acetylase RimI-like enzyme
MMNRTKKIILSISIIAATCSAIGLYVHQQHQQITQGPIYDFNPTRDTQAIMDIFHQNWYWLLASEESSPAFMLKHRTPDANPMHFGSLHIKVLYANEESYSAKASKGSRLAGFTAYFMENAQEGRILFLAVAHEFRGKGYGKLLAEYAMKQMFNMGATHIALWTRVSNLPAQKVYKELGFKEKFDDNGYVFFEYWPE